MSKFIELRDASRRNFYFHGNWLVNYEAKEFNYPDILITLAEIQDYFCQSSINFNSINIIFNKNGRKNNFYQEKGNILLSFCSMDKEFKEIKTKPSDSALWEPLEKPIQSIDLLFPRLDNDPRWKTMALPAGQLLLASSLHAGGFKATPLPLVLPEQNRLSEAILADLTGITLFEDLLPVLGPFLAVFRASYKGIIAAGGPFPTLSPLAAIYHLPSVNLVVRGEAELALPKVLNALNQGDKMAFFALDGVFWQQPGLIAMANFDRVNRPNDLEFLPINLNFLKVGHIKHGLEMNFSRGCCRGCRFCCRVQGTKFRKLPLEKADELLEEYRQKVDGFLGSPRPHSGPPPLVRGGSYEKSATGFHSSCPPLSKGGNRGDPYGGEPASTPQIPSVSQSPRPHSGPPPLVKGVSNAKSAAGFHSSCPPLSKGGNRGDPYGDEPASNPQIPSVSQSPRPHAGPPPLVKGVSNAKSAADFHSSCPPLSKGGNRGDPYEGEPASNPQIPSVSQSPRPHAGPPPLVRGGSYEKSATGFHSSCPPLSKGGNRGDPYGDEPASNPQIPSVSQSPRPHAGPTPLVRGVSNAKSAAGFHSSCPPLSKGGNRGDLYEGSPQEMARTVNINDDDILQDPAYANEIFNRIRKHGLRIFGIQTSTASLVKSNGSPDLKVLDLVSDPGLYVDDLPLLWLGSDTFLTARARRLGKKLPPAGNFARLLAEMEKHGLRHFHYWISSDGDSTWEEFIEELALIFGFFRDFPGFGLLAHAPFIVPYPASLLFKCLPVDDPRLKLKLSLDSPDERFDYRVVERLETKWSQLNALLRNEKAGGEKGFFDFLKEKNFMAAAQLAYHFLKQEELQNPVRDPQLFSAREKLENLIGELLDIHDS